MLKKINLTLGIIAIIGAVICGAYYTYQYKFSETSVDKVTEIVKEVF